MSARVTIVVPVYNEGGNIRQTLAELDAKVSVDAVVWLVYDSEDDTTLPPARELEGRTRLPFRLVRNKYGCGALNAIKTGLEDAATELIVVTMADLCDPPGVINEMVSAADREKADIVCASRYMKGGRQIGGPWFKGFLSHTAGRLLHWFARLPTHDPTNSFKLYRKSFLEEVTIDSTGGFELGLELVVKANNAGRRVVEVPTLWRDRVSGKSNFKLLKWLPNYTRWFLRAFIPDRRSLAMFFLLATPVAMFFACVAMFAWNAPWWDDFRTTLMYLGDSFPERLCHIADFHNEHRLVVPRLIFEVFDLLPGAFPFLACTVFGDLILIGYVFMLGGLFRREGLLLYFVPFMWLFLDLGNCENTLWTLTSIQSHAVLLFALASVLAFARRERARYLLLSVFFAVCSTATSASGIGIWPALAIAALLDGKGCRGFFTVAVAATAVVVPYMHGFRDATVAHVDYGGFSFVGMIDFTLCLLGNLAPIAAVARLLGALSCAAVVLILINFRKFRCEPVFWFLLYLLSVVAAGALCRSALPGAGLFYRLEIIAISIFCCEGYLLARLAYGTRLHGLFRFCMIAAIPIAIVANIVAIYVGSPTLRERKAEIESGYRAWPKERNRLVHWDAEEADRIMQKYVDRKFGGKMPKEPAEREKREERE